MKNCNYTYTAGSRKEFWCNCGYLHKLTTGCPCRFNIWTLVHVNINGMIMHCKLFFLFLVGEGKIYDYHSVNITDLRLCREWHHLLPPLTITHLQESTGNCLTKNCLVRRINHVRRLYGLCFK